MPRAPPAALLEPDPGPQRRRLGMVERDRQADRVLPLDTEAWVQDAFGPVPVIGQEEQPFGIEIEATDRVEARPVWHQRRWDEIEDRRLGMPVLGRGGNAGRLVEGHVGAHGADADQDPVDLDLRGPGIHGFAEGGGAPVDAHPPGADQRLARPARCHPRGGEDLLEPFLIHRAAHPRRRRRLADRGPRRAGRRHRHRRAEDRRAR